MFLKRLELHGFKSFAHKTAIDFMPGVTIVVGPNGCGKSNVLDAMRWVLGETSAKSLRGAKMGDVVFRGSASMKAANFAQVNLIVNNEAANLKIDQTEVMVTRRLFSDGDAEYQINKQKARMRDVHELFLDTGLGADGYSVIEQGQIGQMVAAKPSERRDLFEEAAGISRFKVRREETLRKLVRTEEDLVRLFDIVSEVERSCNSLYRQAKKAERFRKLTRRLQRFQRHLIVLRHSQLETRLEGVLRRQEEVRAEFEAANSKLATAEAARAESTRMMEEFQRQFQELQQQRYDLQNTINREQRRAESARQMIQAVDERAQLLEREITSSTNRLSILANTMSALEEDLHREQGALNSELLRTDDKSRQLDRLRQEHDAANSQLARLRNELQSERAKESKVQQDRSVAASLVERLETELANHDTMVAELKAQVEEAQERAETARVEMEARRARVTSLREEGIAISQRISSNDKEKNMLAVELDKIAQAHNQAASRLQALQELEDSFEGFFRGVQVVMKASQSGRLQGIVGVLSNVLNVPKEYETAVEVALGGSLQDIITHSERHAQEAIRYLKESKAGRATFLPLDLLTSSIRYDHLYPIMKRPGVVGLAKDLIRYDKEIERAVERRLGNTLIVDELRTAVNLQREGIRNRYVALDGELVDPSGVMTGGSVQSRGLLSRTREIRTLRDEVDALAVKRKALADRLALTKDQLSQDYARAASIQSEAHNEQMAETRSEKDSQAAEGLAKERRNQLATAEARQVQQRLDLRKHQETIALCDVALGELGGRIAAHEAELNAADSEFGSRAQLLSSLGEEVSTGRASLSALRERVTGLARKLEEIKRDSGSAGSEQERRETEKRQLAHNREGAERELAGAEALLSGLVREKDALEASISQMTQENETSLRSAREGVAEVQGLQRDRNQKENALREVETSVTELKAQLEYIKREAEDEFAETIEQIAESLEAAAEAESEALVSPDGAVEEQDPREEDALTEEEEAAMSDPAILRKMVNELREKLSRIGAVNETAIEEYKTQKERLDFLTAQRDDLVKAKDSLTATIKELDETTSRLFHEAFAQIRTNFQENFRRLFNGGKGDLIMVEEEGQPEPGIDIFAQPPGKNIGGSITLMSGGEKAMTAIGLMLALFQFKPSPICVLDEIDAPLDDVNCQRLCDALKEYARTTQFLIITHNKITMALADTIYGVTMQEPGISKLVSVKFQDIDSSGLLETAS
ncbi:chromosome segregation protein SMC [bacterium]|nr:chromosome segregation protein SMC [bacterium]